MSKRQSLWWPDSYEEDLVERQHRSVTVLDQDKPTFTGLYDSAGRALHHVPQPFGFRGGKRTS